MPLCPISLADGDAAIIRGETPGTKVAISGTQ
jgi:hypothetical protein